MSFRLVLAGIAVSLVLGLAGGCWLLSGQLSAARAQRDAAIAELDQAHRAIEELALERLAAERRAAIVQDARESIIAAPPESDGPVAQVLRDAMDAADRIGGLP